MEWDPFHLIEIANVSGEPTASVFRIEYATETLVRFQQGT
jgi:hypothetical protein